MTNRSKFWAGALIVGAVATGVVLANRARLNVPSDVPAPPAVAAPAPEASTAASRPAPRRITPESLPVSAQLVDVVKPLLQPGTDVSLAAQGFASREAFVTTAYAAKNLGIPFVLLKDRVVTNHESLADAIRNLKPNVNGGLEATRANAEARADLARNSIG